MVLMGLEIIYGITEKEKEEKEKRRARDERGRQD
jgi:hypothetical protein